jgi:predicted RNA binding protein YcfA (HicA-like mRNA interferase family)
MSKKEKLLKRFTEKPPRKDLTFTELETLLKALSFDKVEGSGSRVKFVKDGLLINLHKPHPDDTLKVYIVKQIQQKLKEMEQC